MQILFEAQTRAAQNMSDSEKEAYRNAHDRFGYATEDYVGSCLGLWDMEFVDNHIDFVNESSYKEIYVH